MNESVNVDADTVRSRGCLQDEKFLTEDPEVISKELKSNTKSRLWLRLYHKIRLVNSTLALVGVQIKMKVLMDYKENQKTSTYEYPGHFDVS